MQLLETLLNGFLLGGLYGLIGLGLSINFGTMRVVYLAHGDLIVLAAYFLVLVLVPAGIPPLLAAALVVPVLFAIGWGLQTDPQTIVRGLDAEWLNDRDSALRLCAKVPCPTLVIQGSADALVGPARGAAVADAIPQARLITLEGSGHAPHLRDPVITNLLIRDFVSRAVRQS